MPSLQVKLLTSPADRIRGLMFTQKAIPVQINTRFGIHTFGVRFSIDVLVLDRQNRIIRIKKSLPPNSLYFWPPVYDRIIELPEGYIFKHRLHFHDQIIIKKLISPSL